ncbi:MAG: transcriptional regulator [Candidatus Thiodiazotropha sp. (ex Semelilucina semeliformis)]|nr:transcriptional regulator [Candidatus Thiodiazotropha sp. (ex Semelilucina semeliformis)]MCU7877213.1 transcriptional regulator [Candidatus Thiodiazotropha sp. (ex Lucinoma borealis)]
MTSKLSELLFSEYRRKVLGLLLLHPDQAYHVREIARLTGTVAGTLHKELSKLADAEILLKRSSGNQVLYQANRDGLVYQELASITRKTFGVTDVLREALQTVIDQLDFAFVYGSVAKEEDRSSSDIDLMVVTDQLAYADLMNNLLDAESQLGRTINPSVYDLLQIKQRLKQKNAFLTRVMEQPKIWIKGTEDDVKTLGES